MVLCSFLPFIHILSRILFFLILCTYLLRLIRKYVIPVIKEGFSEDLCTVTQLREDHQACLMEKEQLEKGLKAQRDMFDGMKKELDRWVQGFNERRKREQIIRLDSMEIWRARQLEIMNLEKGRKGISQVGRVVLLETKAKLKSKLAGEHGKKVFEKMIGQFLNGDLETVLNNRLK